MKRVQILTVMMLMLLMAGNNPLNAQRRMRGMRMDTLRTHRMDSAGMDRMRMRIYPDSTGNRFMRHGMVPAWGAPMRKSMGPMWGGRGMGQMWNHPFGRGMGPMWMGPMHRNMGHAWWGPSGWSMDSTAVNRMRYRMDMRDSIPGLTSGQKAALDKLRLKNQTEMKKLREETAAKMRSIREEHRKEMMNLLTPEQKKWFESNFPGSKGAN